MKRPSSGASVAADAVLGSSVEEFVLKCLCAALAAGTVLLLLLSPLSGIDTSGNAAAWENSIAWSSLRQFLTNVNPLSPSPPPPPTF
jgi:hypothetical protein